ncbi:MAG: hypothetical protein CMO81_03420 [Waddliaceae bacterium]|nr:hypothetical protein [Waddliaceae bacterium]
MCSDSVNPLNNNEHIPMQEGHNIEEGNWKSDWSVLDGAEKIKSTELIGTVYIGGKEELGDGGKKRDVSLLQIIKVQYTKDGKTKTVFLTKTNRQNYLRWDSNKESPNLARIAENWGKERARDSKSLKKAPTKAGNVKSDEDKALKKAAYNFIQAYQKENFSKFLSKKGIKPENLEDGEVSGAIIHGKAFRNLTEAGGSIKDLVDRVEKTEDFDELLTIYNNLQLRSNYHQSGLRGQVSKVVSQFKNKFSPNRERRGFSSSVDLANQIIKKRIENVVGNRNLQDILSNTNPKLAQDRIMAAMLSPGFSLDLDKVTSQDLNDFKNYIDSEQGKDFLSEFNKIVEKKQEIGREFSSQLRKAITDFEKNQREIQKEVTEDNKVIIDLEKKQESKIKNRYNSLLEKINDIEIEISLFSLTGTIDEAKAESLYTLISGSLRKDLHKDDTSAGDSFGINVSSLVNNHSAQSREQNKKLYKNLQVLSAGKEKVDSSFNNTPKRLVTLVSGNQITKLRESLELDSDLTEEEGKALDLEIQTEANKPGKSKKINGTEKDSYESLFNNASSKPNEERHKSCAIEVEEFKGSQEELLQQEPRRFTYGSATTPAEKTSLLSYSTQSENLGVSHINGSIRQGFQHRGIGCEDRMIIYEHKLNVDDKEVPFLIPAVIDGHHGKDVAHKVQEKLPKKIIEKLENSLSSIQNPSQRTEAIRGAIKKAFYDLGSELKSESSGADVCCPVLFKGEIFCANLGDSRACIWETGDASSVEFLSRDSSHDDLSQSRAAAMEGQTFCYSQNKQEWRARPVLKGLAGEEGGIPSSRSLGDAQFKTIFTPEVSSRRLEPGKKYRMAVFSDGISDILSAETLSKFIDEGLSQGKSAEEVNVEINQKLNNMNFGKETPLANLLKEGDDRTLIIVEFTVPPLDDVED